MASRYEVELTVGSAQDLKNVNWRHGKLRPYVVAWVDSSNKVSTRVDDEGDTNPRWDHKLVIPFNTPIDDATLHVDIVHADAEEDTKPLVGSAKIPLKDFGLGGGVEDKKLELKRPSGRPQGKVDVKVTVREPRYPAPQQPYYAPPYGVPPAGSTRDYPAAAAAPPYGYAPPYAAPPSGYPAYGAPYGQPGYGQPPQGGYYGQPQGYGQPSYGGQGGYNYGQGYAVEEEKKKSKFGGMGMGTGLAVGAVAGALGGLALAEGFDALEDKIADDAAERVEDDLDAGGYDGDDY